jgi:hypothetical protein
MQRAQNHQFSGPVTVFQERRLPVRATPAGYAAIIDALNLKVPLPRILSATGTEHRIIRRDDWNIYTPRHAPAGSLEGHLTFALKYEGLDLAVLKRAFERAGPESIAAIVRGKPTGSYARRIWFLYEWLTATRLDIPDVKRGKYVPAVDETQQYGVSGQNSARHRVRNNLPGRIEFCPLVFKTERLEAFIAKDLAKRAARIVAAIQRDVLARAAAFLLLKDSRSSYAIEGERPARDRVQRWGRAIGEAGRKPLDLDELLRLQKIVIGDERFVKLGLRREGGFIGEHDRATGAPLPEHIDARSEDLPSLVDALVGFERAAGQNLDPVMAAAVLAFGFVYVHPFEDGNGRLHRFLIHHMLTARGFNPTGVVFPVSAAILRNVADYKAVLESYSARLLPVVDWEPTPKGNVHVLNDTADFYRYFDATPQTEFLYRCVDETIESDLPQETAFLKAYDSFREQVQVVADMPHRTMDMLFRFLHQNNGKLPNRALKGEFATLTSSEVEMIERIYRDCFEPLKNHGGELVEDGDALAEG